MRIEEAVRERIIELCQEQDISINKLSNISGVTQSTVNNIITKSQCYDLHHQKALRWLRYHYSRFL